MAWPHPPSATTLRDPRCFDVDRLCRDVQAASGNLAGSPYGIAPIYEPGAGDNVWLNGSKDLLKLADPMDVYKCNTKRGK